MPKLRLAVDIAKDVFEIGVARPPGMILPGERVIHYAPMQTRTTTEGEDTTATTPLHRQSKRIKMDDWEEYIYEKLRAAASRRRFLKTFKEFTFGNFP